MDEHLHFQRLFQSLVVTINDVRCRPSVCERGPEEYSDVTTVVFPRSGAFVRHVGRQQILANCNHVLFFRGGEAYRVSHPVPGGDDCTSLAFDRDILTDAVSRFDPGARERPHSPLAIADGPSWPAFCILLHRLRQQLRAGNGDQLAVEEVAVALLEAVLDSAFRARGQRPVRAKRSADRIQRERVEGAKSFITAHFREQLSLARIARAVYYSPFHLARLFGREVGQPLHRYLNRLRLGFALEQLAEGADDLTALGLYLGFSSHSHFSSTFRREFGMPPSALRQALPPGRLRQLSKILKAGAIAAHVG